MKLSTSLVAVKKVVSHKPRSSFVDDKIEQAAQLILDSEGIINPIVVTRTSLQSYEVVDGDFEYYAAVRAREIDPRKGEMIGVFIIEPENKDHLTKQVELFRKEKFHPTEPNSLDEISFSSKGLDKFFNILEDKFVNKLELLLETLTKQVLEQSTTRVKLEIENQELKKQLTEKLKPLEVFQRLDEKLIHQKLINAGFNKTKAEQIASAVVNEREEEQFKSLSDVIQRVKIPQDKQGKKMQKGISPEKMVDFIESLSLED